MILTVKYRNIYLPVIHYTADLCILLCKKFPMYLYTPIMSVFSVYLFLRIISFYIEYRFEDTCSVYYRTILRLLNFKNFCSVHRYVQREANFLSLLFFQYFIPSQKKAREISPQSFIAFNYNSAHIKSHAIYE